MIRGDNLQEKWLRERKASMLASGWENTAINPRKIKSAGQCRESHNTKKKVEWEKGLHCFDYKNERI